MPIRPGEHADILRAIGRLLDAEGGDVVQLTSSQRFINVSWRSKFRTDERQYMDHNLDDLRQAARDSRGDIGKSPAGGFADLFRTLGQDLDREQAELSEVLQEGDEFIVTGSIAGRPMRWTYTKLDLLASSQRRRAWRRPDADVENESRMPSQLNMPRVSRPQDPDDEGPLSRRLRQ